MDIVLGTGVSGQFRPLDNFRAIVAPGVTDDITKGYSAGSMWIDLVANAAYICVDNSVGAAVWYGVGAGSSGITQLTGDVTAGPGSASQAATLADTAVTPGTYTNARVTVDSKGRITVASGGQYFSASSSAVQNTSDSNPVKLHLDTVTVDTEGAYDNVLYRYTPNIAGYYYIHASFTVRPPAAGSVSLWIVKNGSATFSPGFDSGLVALVEIPMVGSAMLSMNGSTDYVELWAATNFGANAPVNAGANLSAILLG